MDAAEAPLLAALGWYVPAAAVGASTALKYWLFRAAKADTAQRCAAFMGNLAGGAALCAGFQVVAMTVAVCWRMRCVSVIFGRRSDPGSASHRLSRVLGAPAERGMLCRACWVGFLRL